VWLNHRVIQGLERLSPDNLAALAALEQAVVTADGGRLKLEWPVLESGERVEALLWWEGKQLVGFLGLYAFAPETLEMAGMVAPGWRRRRIGTALLQAALSRCRERGCGTPLLVVPRSSVPGRSLALQHGGALDHSEHALVLVGKPVDKPRGPQIILRRATPQDAVQVSRLLEAAFGHPAPGLSGRLVSDQERTLLIESAGSTVGTVRLTRHGDEAGIYGLAVDPAWQHQGIGRAVLRQVCEQLRQEGARQVGLEVAVDNERALGLYTSSGFTVVTTEDYYAISAEASRAYRKAI
jgi:ribosomal protein S18 acetylase RimI-like enzyme